MDHRDAKKRLLAAQTLLLEPSTSVEKFSSIKKLIKGINPSLDHLLEHTERELVTLERMLKLDVIPLALEKLPQNTPEEKRRKRAIVFFFEHWNQLKGEVSRVQAEINAAQSSPDTVHKGGHLARILNFAKGPFASVTVIAVVLVGAGTWTSKSSVQINIKNVGCPTMIPSSSMPNFIPGISFPTEPIKTGSTAIVRLPGVPIVFDGSKKGELLVTSFKLHMTFELGAITDATFDNEELMGHLTEIHLGDKPTHFLELICK